MPDKQTTMTLTTRESLGFLCLPIGIFGGPLLYCIAHSMFGAASIITGFVLVASVLLCRGFNK
ncbi:hypothetical protein [Gluconacetobacter sp.]|uniref:hypothetical protein n=1 Tax=Gluconacetobacter sp. TaxID=1935994 RepID=UPI0039EC07F4